MRDGSWWTFSHIVELHLHMNKFVSVNGKSYIRLPVKLAQKKTIINVINEESRCLQ